MSKPIIVAIAIACLAFLSWCGVSSRADMAVVDAGDEIYAQCLAHQKAIYAIGEELAQSLMDGKIDYQTYLERQAHLMRDLQQYDYFIKVREDLLSAPDSKIAEFYRAWFGWGLFPP